MSIDPVIVNQIKQARYPEHLFGPNSATVVSTYKLLTRHVHPDVNNNSEESRSLTAELNQWKEEADRRVKAGTYGDKRVLEKFTPIELGAYQVARKPVVGAVADVYKGTGLVTPRKLNPDGGGLGYVLKVARHPDDNDLLRAEREALTMLNKRIVPPVRSGVPTLLDSFQVADATGWQREVNVLERFDGFLTVQEVKAAMSPGRVKPETLVWMFKRMLVLLEWTHHYGYVHGAILPPHVLFYPDNDEHRSDSKKLHPDPRDERKHSVRLVGWGNSVEYGKRTRLSAWEPAWKDFYAPELLAKESVSPASDIFMAAKLLMHLDTSYGLAGPLFEVLKKCLQKDPSRRYQKVDEVYRDWVEAASSTFGVSKWVEFEVPVGAAV